MSEHLFRKVIRWLLALVSVFVIITGLGIAEFRTVTAITMGALDKVLSFKLHTYLWIPFLVLLAVHVLYPYFAKALRRINRQDKFN